MKQLDHSKTILQKVQEKYLYIVLNNSSLFLDSAHYEIYHYHMQNMVKLVRCHACYLLIFCVIRQVSHQIHFQSTFFKNVHCPRDCLPRYPGSILRCKMDYKILRHKMINGAKLVSGSAVPSGRHAIMWRILRNEKTNIKVP